MREYMAMGIDSFIMSGYPHLEEAYRFAELVLPRLRWRTARSPRGVGTTHRGPFGEMIGNTKTPQKSASLLRDPNELVELDIPRRCGRGPAVTTG